MVLIIRQLRALAPYRRKQRTSSSTDVTLAKSNAVSAATRHGRAKKARPQVTISKDPPSIIYFEQRHDEASFECIFDPNVCHDNEDDHPDLHHEQRRLKPWQLPPYTNNYMTPSTGNASRMLKLFGIRLPNKSVGVKPGALSTAKM